jgi:hypothetical protein
MATLQNSTVNSLDLGRDAGGNADSNRFGYGSGGSGNTKTAFGYRAGAASSNVRNAFVGAQAGRYNSGFYNTAVGQCAMRGSGGGCKSTAIGQRALQSWASGRDVHAVGSFAGNSNNGVQNAFAGVNAGRLNSASNSTMIGVDSGCNTTGTENTAFGFRALRSNTSGIRNIALGTCSVYNNNADWRIGIGYGSQPSATCGHISWGSSLNNKCNCVYGNWYYGSDGRDKTNVQDLRAELGLNFLRRLRPVSYRWDNRDQYVNKCGFEYGVKDGTLADPREHYGLVAQELKEVLTELNETFEGLHYDQAKDAYRVQYASFIAPLTKAIKELDQRTQQLKQQVGLA